MILTRQEQIHLNDERLKIFEKNLDYQGYLTHYLKYEPHTLYNMGHVLKIIKNFRSSEKILSIGIDPMKELILMENYKFEKLDVFDIDKELVEAGNKFWENSKINIQYHYIDLLREELENNYDTALLFQMDYIFSDSQLSDILTKFEATKIKNCYLITPSLFNVNITNVTSLDILIYDSLHLLFYFFNSIKKNMKAGSNLNSDNSYFYPTYKRSKLHLTKLFKRHSYKTIAEKGYLNQNGSFNLFHFELDK